MAEHTPTPWFKNRKFEVGPRPRTDDQSDGMLHPVADVFGDNQEANAALIVEAVNAYEPMKAELESLRAKLREVESDSPVSRLQFPDGTVPGNDREAAEGWHRYYDQVCELHGNEIKRCQAYEAEVSRLAAQVERVAWSTDFSKAPTKPHDFFLLRPREPHPATGKPCIPSIVQRIDGEFYTPENELEPVYFGQNEADDHPLKTTLEWKPLPAEWLAFTSTAERKDAS